MKTTIRIKKSVNWLAWSNAHIGKELQAEIDSISGTAVVCFIINNLAIELQNGLITGIVNLEDYDVVGVEKDTFCIVGQPNYILDKYFGTKSGKSFNDLTNDEWSEEKKSVNKRWQGYPESVKHTTISLIKQERGIS